MQLKGHSQEKTKASSTKEEFKEVEKLNLKERTVGGKERKKIEHESYIQTVPSLIHSVVCIQRE